MRTIVYINHDIDDLCLFEYVLHEIDRSIKVFSFSDTSSAFRSFDKGLQPHLVIIHIPLPKISEEECLSVIRRYKHLKTVPVILNTAGFTKYEQKLYLELGATAVIAMQNQLINIKRQMSLIVDDYLPMD